MNSRSEHRQRTGEDLVDELVSAAGVDSLGSSRAASRSADTPEPSADAPQPAQATSAARPSRSRTAGKSVRVGALIRRDTSEWYQRLGYAENTGNDHDIGGIFFHGAVLEAVRELQPDINLHRISRDNLDDAVERIKQALRNLSG